MRRQLSFTSERGRSARRRLLLATALIVAVFLVDALFGGKLSGIVRSIGASVWNASASVRTSITNSGYFVAHSTLAHDNATLREQVANYQEDAAAYQAALDENDALRALVHLAESEKGITAPIVSSFRTSPYGTFMIGAGTTDGVGNGSHVMTSDGFVIGTVTEEGAHTSLVTSVFASGSSIDALVGRTAAVVEGRGGGNAVAELSRDVAVAERQSVIAPSLGSRPIGVVGHVERSEASAQQTVYIQLPVNLSTLRYIYVTPKP